MTDRIPVALAKRLAVNPFRRPNRYVDWNGHKLLAETVCKRCGRVLTAMGPDPRVPPMSREVKGTKVRTIIRETPVCRLRTPDFDVIEFEVEEPLPVFVPEGDETQDEHEPRLGLHRTSLCTPCKDSLLDGNHDLEEVQQLYEADLERMATEDEVNRVAPSQTHEVLSRLMTRKVTRIVG